MEKKLKNYWLKIFLGIKKIRLELDLAKKDTNSRYLQRYWYKIKENTLHFLSLCWIFIEIFSKWRHYNWCRKIHVTLKASQVLCDFSNGRVKGGERRITFHDSTYFFFLRTNEGGLSINSIFCALFHCFNPGIIKIKVQFC